MTTVSSEMPAKARATAKSAARAAAHLDGHPLMPYLLVLPATAYLLVFQIFPLLQELWLSFTSTSLLSASQSEWVGLGNYKDLLGDPDFRKTIGVTLIYTSVCVVSAIALGLLSALLLDAPFRGRGFARAAVTIPWAAPPVAVALIVDLDLQRAVRRLRPRAALLRIRVGLRQLARQC